VTSTPKEGRRSFLLYASPSGWWIQWSGLRPLLLDLLGIVILLCLNHF
jgi:hypothetical protein